MGTTQLLYQAAGFEVGKADKQCWLCGGPAFDPVPRKEFVKPTFTDHDKVTCPDSDVVCGACVFCHEERSELLASLVGKEKPQRMRNYSHFIVGGKWIPLSKGDKLRMADLLMQGPELAVIALSGQKHIIFRAQPGWWQIEEQSALPFPSKLRELLEIVESLCIGFSKKEIESGEYRQDRIMKFGLLQWQQLENQIAPLRGSINLELAIFLAQKGDGNAKGTSTKVVRAIGNRMGAGFPDRRGKSGGHSPVADPQGIQQLDMGL